MTATVEAMTTPRRKPKLSPKQVKARRLKAGLTQQEAADRCGVSRQAWNRYEAGTLIPHPAVQQIIATF